MDERHISPTEGTYNNLIDGYVRAEQFDKAKEIYKEKFSDKYKPEDGVLDLHDLSHGSACAAILTYFEKKGEELTLITGIGHGSIKPYAMQEAILDFIFKHPALHLRTVPVAGNSGRLIIRKK